jgi:hypothetical protein
MHPAVDLFAAGQELPSKFKFAATLLKKVMGALDYREKLVYLDQNLPNERRRFTHGHELGHEVLPWHKHAYFADDGNTLSSDTRDQLEMEANAFSAELLFGLGRFTTMADDYKPGLGAPLALNSEFQTSAAATIRRYVETTRHTVALVTLGRIPVQPNGRLSLKVMPAMTTQSATFAERYGPAVDMVGYAISVKDQPAVQLAHTAGQGGREAVDMALDTKRGTATFHTESFNNGHLNFLILSRRRRLLGRPVKIVH